jgi:hypothetical protein
MHCQQTLGLSGLVSFAEHCPNLRQLPNFVAATVNVPTNREFFQVWSKGISNTFLTHLDVGRSPNNATTVAVAVSLLSLIFPSLQSVTPDGNSREVWAQVMQLAPTHASMNAGYEQYLASIDRQKLQHTSFRLPPSKKVPDQVEAFHVHSSLALRLAHTQPSIYHPETTLQNEFAVSSKFHEWTCYVLYLYTTALAFLLLETMSSQLLTIHTRIWVTSFVCGNTRFGNLLT